MNEAEKARFRTLIEARFAELRAGDALGHDGQLVVPLDQQSVGRLSRMDALQAQAMAKAQQSRRDAEAGRLRQALARIEEGEFGWCEDCGEEIAVKRLELNPATRLCINCASG